MTDYPSSTLNERHEKERKKRKCKQESKEKKARKEFTIRIEKERKLLMRRAKQVRQKSKTIGHQNMDEGTVDKCDICTNDIMMDKIKCPLCGNCFHRYCTDRFYGSRRQYLDMLQM